LLSAKIELKEAKRQSPVLTNRNGIRGCYTRISKHTVVTSEDYQNRISVDVAGIGQRKKLLPGEVFTTTSGYVKKSAEVIVLGATSYQQKGIGLTNKEGLNANWF
jgi:hypothetical protein